MEAFQSLKQPPLFLPVPTYYTKGIENWRSDIHHSRSHTIRLKAKGWRFPVYSFECFTRVISMSNSRCPMSNGPEQCR